MTIAGIAMIPAIREIVEQLLTNELIGGEAIGGGEMILMGVQIKIRSGARRGSA